MLRYFERKYTVGIRESTKIDSTHAFVTVYTYLAAAYVVVHAQQFTHTFGTLDGGLEQHHPT